MRREDQNTLRELGYAPLYKKLGVVHATLAFEDGEVETPEGFMAYKAEEHYLVSDEPPTHVWPVRRDIFESTYVLIENE